MVKQRGHRRALETGALSSVAAPAEASAPDWVFGYGSLMWRPDFDFLERRPALLFGYHRAFCIYSVHHRGRPERPGLVFGLDRGGACRGVAFRLDPVRREAVFERLRAREQVTSVYLERRLPIRLDSGAPARAVTFIVDRGHDQYAGKLPLARQAEIVRAGRGESGDNLSYLRETVRHLDEIGVRDRGLRDLLRLADR